MSSAEEENMDGENTSHQTDTSGRKRLVITRYIHTHNDLEAHYSKSISEQISVGSRIRSWTKCSRNKALDFIFTVLPIVNVLKTYKLKEYIPGDVLSGITAACLHFPQGLAFGILANLSPAYGLYTSFFPVLLYVIFGTVPHVSFGTNALIALLTAEIVDIEESSSDPSKIANLSYSSNLTIVTEPDIDVDLELKAATAATATFYVGLFLFLMGIMRLGIITTYLSTSFISGFTFAAAFHIVSSQVPKALGITVGLFKGPAKLVYFYIDIFTNIGNTNVASVIITVICMVILLVIKDCVNERFKDKLKIPIPIDLILVILATVVSYFGNLENNFGVRPVGNIPVGIPTPAVPDLVSSGAVIGDAFVVAILVFFLTISMAKLCAQKHEYEVSDNQELVAYGLANFGSSFFHCFPSCTAPPRTMLLSAMGAKTTLNGIVSAIFILIVLLAAGQLFTSLPIPVLAAMIIVAVRKLILQVLDLPNIWNVNMYDFITWIITCLSGILIDLPYALICGVVWSFFSVIIQSQLSYNYLLGKAGSEDRCISVERRDGVQEVPGVKIFRMEASLYYATAEIFRKRLYKLTVHPKDKMRSSTPNTNKDDVTEQKQEPNGDSSHVTLATKEQSTLLSYYESMADNSAYDTRYIILDCMPVNYMDLNGVRMLKQLFAEYQKTGITLLLARCSMYMHNILEKSDFYDNILRDQVFADVEDGVAYACLTLKTVKTNGNQS